MSPMAQLYLRNAKKVECASAFPPTAISVTVKSPRSCQRTPQFLSIRPHFADRPIRFNGPETVADVLVEGHEMYSQAILGCRDFQLDFRVDGQRILLLEAGFIEGPKSISGSGGAPIVKDLTWPGHDF